MAAQRIDKLLTAMGLCSRREAAAAAKRGAIVIDGAVCRDASQKVDPETARICFCGQTVSYQTHVYLMMHKPLGVLSATEDREQQTVLDLLPAGYKKRGVFPIGRLDKDTEGLLLITNDGALAHRLLSPVKHVPKTYLVHTKKPVTSQMCEKLEAGVEIGDETPTAPAKTKLLSDTDCGLLLTITEGRFHQVKRMLQAVGNEVVYLKRLSMGALVLDETLSKGSWRALTEEEKAQLGV